MGRFLMKKIKLCLLLSLFLGICLNSTDAYFFVRFNEKGNCMDDFRFNNFEKALGELKTQDISSVDLTGDCIGLDVDGNYLYAAASASLRSSVSACCSLIRTSKATDVRPK